MSDDELAALRQEIRAVFAEMRAEFGHVRARVDGLPLLGAAIEALRHDVRAAINDIARVKALHADHAGRP